MNDVYEVKHPQRAGGVISSAVNCGYSRKTLKSLSEAGYDLLKNDIVIVKGKRNEQN